VVVARDAPTLLTRQHNLWPHPRKRARIASRVLMAFCLPIEGNIVADFPLCNKSFNCSYSGHDL